MNATATSVRRTLTQVRPRAILGLTTQRSLSRHTFTLSPKISHKISPKMADNSNASYQDWSKDRLVDRVRELEEQLRGAAVQQKPKKPAKQNKPHPPPPSSNQPQPAKPKEKKKKGHKLDPSKYSTRLVALKLCYLGKRYGGFEYQPSAAAPSIEEELWRALVRSCLIWPDDPDKVDFAPWEYSKCGRTDRGVSAFGQVVGIRVRSNRPVETAAVEEDVEMENAEGEKEGEKEGGKPAWDPVADEINYPRVLNRLLPPDIRVLAWAPTLPADFSARFSCWERQYRYFFTQPAFSPLPASLDPEGTRAAEGWLDIDAMREAAKRFEGVHDFRNFCKVDGAKQLTNFKRRMFEADIVEVEGAGSVLPYLGQSAFAAAAAGTHPKVYYFHVRGSAFLWHQIRHMVAVLFLVGQGLEKPSLVTELLDVEKHPRRPNYTMAEEVPLVLWDCIFPKADAAASKKASLEVHDAGVESNTRLVDGMDWVWLGEDRPSFLHGAGGMADQLWECWRERKMDELLASQLLDSVVRRPDLTRRLADAGPPDKSSGSQRVYEGGNSVKSSGRYVPMLKKVLLASPDEVNDKWAQSKGFSGAAELAGTENWRSVIKANKSGASAVVDTQPGGDGSSIDK